MIALLVKINGKRICIAGAEDLSVLSADVAAIGKLGDKTAPFRKGGDSYDLHYSVGGLTHRGKSKQDVHLRWKSVAPLRLGDVIEVAVVEVNKADRPKTRKAARERA